MSHCRFRSIVLPACFVCLALIAAACGDGASDAAATDDARSAADAESTTAAPATSPPTVSESTPAVPTTEAPETVPADTAPPETPAPTTTAAAPEFDFSAISPIVEGYIAENELNGAGLIIVHRDHGVIHHDHWGEFSEDRVSLIASSSKMITAGVLLHLQDEGLLDIDAPVADVVEWGSANPAITPAQLLSNSSGLVGLFPDAAFGPYLCQYLNSGTMQTCASTIFTTADDDTEVVEPDTEFRYGGAQWQVAGAVAEVASGQSWAELIDDIYVEPCGVATLGYNNHFASIGTGFDYPVAFNADPGTLEPTENPNMEGGAYITTGDYGKLLLMHLRDGRCGDTQVLSTEALAAMHGDRIDTAYDGDAYGEDTGYGMGWWVNRPTGRITDEGAYGSVPWIDLEDGYGAYLVIEASSALGGALAAQLYDVVEETVTGG